MGIPKKLVFEISGPADVKVYGGSDEKFTGTISELIDEVQVWCRENNCGIRTSFNTFRFHNQKERTMFLLRWA